MTDGSEGKGRPEDGKTKQVVIIGSIVIFVAAIGTLILVLVGPGETRTKCQIIRQATAEGLDHSLKYDVSEINECQRDFDCLFDVNKCDVACPLGFEKDENHCAISCQCSSDSKGTFQGDIQFDDSEVHGLLMRYGYIENEETFSVFSSSVKESTELWPKSSGDRVEIAYAVKPGTSLSRDRRGIEAALDEFKRKTCIEFVPQSRQEGSPYIYFVSGSWCASRVGMQQKSKAHRITLSPSCRTPGIVIHQLMHAVGFEHEHVRPDRDAYITVNLDNVERNKHPNFAKIREPVRNVGRPYDYDSVTHMGSHAWAKSDDLYSFTKTDSDPVIGQREGLSDEDANEINILYGCKKGLIMTEVDVLNPSKGDTAESGGSGSTAGSGSDGGSPGSDGGSGSTTGSGSDNTSSGSDGGLGSTTGSGSDDASSGSDGGSGSTAGSGDASTGSESGSNNTSTGSTAGFGSDNASVGTGFTTEAGSDDGSESTAGSGSDGASTGSDGGSGVSGSDNASAGSESTAGTGSESSIGSNTGSQTTAGSGSTSEQTGSTSGTDDGSQTATGSGSTNEQTGSTSGSESGGYDYQESKDKAWNEWVPWSDCTKTCGVSEAIRYRRCVNPMGILAYGCLGDWYEEKKCVKQDCAEKYGEWEDWNSWDKCSRTCNIGYQWR